MPDAVELNGVAVACVPEAQLNEIVPNFAALHHAERNHAVLLVFVVHKGTTSVLHRNPTNWNSYKEAK